MIYKICISRLHTCSGSLSLLHIWFCSKSCVLAVPLSPWHLMEKKHNPKTRSHLVQFLSLGPNIIFSYLFSSSDFIYQTYYHKGRWEGKWCDLSVLEINQVLVIIIKIIIEILYTLKLNCLIWKFLWPWPFPNSSFRLTFNYLVFYFLGGFLED